MPTPRVLITALLVLDAVLIGLGIYYGYINHHDPGYFMREGKSLTHLSALHLGAVAVLAFGIFRMRQPVAGRTALLWLLIGAGFGFLVVDELAQFHENLDKWIHHWLAIKPNRFTTRLDDLIILGYGLIGAGALWVYRDELKNYRNLLPLLVAGFALMAASVGMDLFTHRTDAIRIFIADPHQYLPVLYWLKPLEDALKMLAEGMFLGTFYAAYRQTAAVSRNETPGRPAAAAL